MSQPIPAAVEPQAVIRLADPETRYRAVRLVTDLLKREPTRPFARPAPGAAWELDLSLPSVDRLEYQLQAVTADGAVELLLHPDAPRASGPFGDKSVLELAAYSPPGWLDADVPDGELEPLRVRSEKLRGAVEGLLWRPPETDPDGPLPLLVVHDGPEYAEHSALLRYLAWAVAAGETPPVRAALLAPLRRNDHYGASPRYAAALAEELIPALAPHGPVAGLGASLGALALLHAHALQPGVFGGLFLQSGSFFQPSTDAWESDHPRFGPITRFVGRVLAGRQPLTPVPLMLTCSSGEENLINNRALRNALLRGGWDAGLTLVRDGHNWVAWRDALHPHLGRLLARLAP